MAKNRKILLKTKKNYTLNFSPKRRNKKTIKFVILHYTGMVSEKKAIKKLINEKSKVSSHYFIKKNGEIINLLPDTYEAWHAGVSKWKKLRSLNKYSIGIEIDNPGHKFGYKKFSNRQISSIITLLRYLKKKYNIKKENFLGHSDIAPERKKDPGEKFPWKFLSKKKLCIWHNLSDKKLKPLRVKKINLLDQSIFWKNLSRIGYDTKKEKSLVIKAFQRRFRQSLINGKADKECFFISKSLNNLSY